MRTVYKHPVYATQRYVVFPRDSMKKILSVASTGRNITAHLPPEPTRLQAASITAVFRNSVHRMRSRLLDHRSARILAALTATDLDASILQHGAAGRDYYNQAAMRSGRPNKYPWA